MAVRLFAGNVRPVIASCNRSQNASPTASSHVNFGIFFLASSATGSASVSGAVSELRSGAAVSLPRDSPAFSELDDGGSLVTASPSLLALTGSFSTEAFSTVRSVRSEERRVGKEGRVGAGGEQCRG